MSIEQIDEQVKYGFELALRYAQLAVKYDRDPVEILKKALEDW